MATGDIVNVAALGLAVFLFVSAGALVRPANGDRPLLVGFMLSAMFGLYMALIRIFDLAQYTRATFGIVLSLWLCGKLWALYATALHTRHPLFYTLRRTWRLVFGYNPKPSSSDDA